MTDHFSDRAFDSLANETQSSSDTGLDEESNLTVHSWQLWSVSRENYLAERTDLKARDVHLATFPNFPPSIGELKARTLKSDARFVMLEHYAGAMGEKKKRINEDTKLLEFSRTETHDRTDRHAENWNGSHPANISAQTSNATVEILRAAFEVLKDRKPAQQLSAGISLEEISAINRRLDDLVAQVQRIIPVEKSDLSRARELMEFRRELLAEGAQRIVQPEISDRDRAMLMLLNDTGASQEVISKLGALLATPDQLSVPMNWPDKVLEAVSHNPQIIERFSNILERVVARVLPNPRIAPSARTASAPPASERIISETSQVNHPTAPSVTQRPQASSPVVQPIEAGQNCVTLDTFVLGIKEDIQEGIDPDDAVADAVTLFSEQAELGPIILGLLEKSNEELFAVLHQATGAKLDGLSNANEYLDGLRDGVRKRLRTPEVDASKNGNN
jgi:hypothetical protein